MRILIYSESFSPELIGVGKYTGEMAEWLALRGHEVRVVTTPPHYPQWKVFEGYSPLFYKKENVNLSVKSKGALEVFRCPSWIPREPRGWKRVLYLTSFSLSSFPILLRQISWKPDIVLLIEPTFLCSPASLFVARWCGAIAWLHVQDFELDVAFQLRDFSSDLFLRWMQGLESFLLRKFDRVSTISNRMMERLSVKGVQADRRVHFPNWVDTSKIYPLESPSPLRQALKIDEQTIVVLFSGSMGRKHGLEFLANASRQLAFRSDVQFVFCGDGPGRELFIELERDTSNVKVLPLQPADRLNELLNLADIHLLPQLSEAADLVMPSKLTGMMASGRPVVATAHAGTQIAETLCGKGVVATPGDLSAFVSAITRLVDNPSLRRQMGEEARRYAVTYLDRETIMHRFELSAISGSGLPLASVEERLAVRKDGKFSAT